MPEAVGWWNGVVYTDLRRTGEIGLWQPRCWERVIRDEVDFALRMRCCWSNPVKHGLAARPADWPHSLILRDIRRGRVDPEWAGEIVEGAFGEA